MTTNNNRCMFPSREHPCTVRDCCNLHDTPCCFACRAKTVCNSMCAYATQKFAEDREKRLQKEWQRRHPRE